MWKQNKDHSCNVKYSPQRLNKYCYIKKQLLLTKSPILTHKVTVQRPFTTKPSTMVCNNNSVKKINRLRDSIIEKSEQRSH